MNQLIQRAILWLPIIPFAIACGGTTPEAATQIPSPEPVDKLIIDVPGFSTSIWTFDNPGGWTVYQGLQLSDPGASIKVNILPMESSTDSFEDFVSSWTSREFEVQKSENGLSYVITTVGSTPTLLIETSDGIRWSFQISERSSGADLEAFIDPVLQIAFSATYAERETDQ